MKKLRVRSILYTCLAVLIAALPLYGGNTGKIAGKVVDQETGFPLPSVNVIVMGTTLGAATDLNGEYFVLNVPPGTYDVKASIIGYSQVVQSGVRVYADLTTTADFKMPSETLELDEVVEVIAERPLIQKDVSSSTKISTADEVLALPVNSVSAAISTAAGTQGSGNNLHIRGGRAGEVAILVDGINVEDPQSRTIGLNVATGAVEELQIISGGFNAEYGNAQSGVILLTTREGRKSEYSGRFSVQTDHFGRSGLGESSQAFEWYEGSLGGPEPITTYLLPAIGVNIPGHMTFFAQGESRIDDASGFHPDALAESGEDNYEKTSPRLRNEPIFKRLFGIGGPREDVLESWNAKLVWQMAPGKKLSFSYRGNHDNVNPRTFINGLDLNGAVVEAQALGFNDLQDNDGDGLIDEEIQDGRDNDGDGVIDEYDSILDERYDFAWGLDNDGDGRTDEEAMNGLDDDGDGLVDEDLQPYDWNGYDNWRRNETRADQELIAWTHTLSANTFYEVRLGRFFTSFSTIPKIGKDGVSPSNFDELNAWIDDWKDADAIRNAARDAGEPVPDFEDLIEPYQGFGFPAEPFNDTNDNNQFDPGIDTFTDWDGDGLWDGGFGTPNPVWFFRGVNHPFRGQRFNGRYWTNDRAGFATRKSTTWSLKFDLTSQVNNNHQVKTGLEVNYFDLKNLSRQLVNPFDGRGLFPNDYHVFPNWQAVYLQDKMEFKSAIVNIGMRLERFDQGSQAEQGDSSRVGIADFDEPETKWSLLPRIGFSFPVTERDVFFFNYGRFFQRPQLSRVYTQVNQFFGSSNSILGNPDLDPEETIQYEFGIRHQFGINTLFTATGFFKDIDNLLQINQRFDDDGDTYFTYFNDTYGTVKGLELEMIQRAGAFFSGEVNYTFQVAKATHSSARDTYTNQSLFATLPGTEFPADWDQRHRFVINLDYHYGNNQGPRLGDIHLLENFNLNVLADFSSGLPYNPESQNGTDMLEESNSLRSPWTYDISLRARRFFNVSGLRLGALFEVRNLLNRRNVIGVDNNGIIDGFTQMVGLTSDGAAGSVRNHSQAFNPQVNPSAWSTGRQIRVGTWVEF